MKVVPSTIASIRTVQKQDGCRFGGLRASDSSGNDVITITYYGLYTVEYKADNLRVGNREEGFDSITPPLARELISKCAGKPITLTASSDGLGLMIIKHLHELAGYPQMAFVTEATQFDIPHEVVTVEASSDVGRASCPVSTEIRTVVSIADPNGSS